MIAVAGRFARLNARTRSACARSSGFADSSVFTLPSYGSRAVLACPSRSPGMFAQMGGTLGRLTAPRTGASSLDKNQSVFKNSPRRLRLQEAFVHESKSGHRSTTLQLLSGSNREGFWNSKIRHPIQDVAGDHRLYELRPNPPQFACASGCRERSPGPMIVLYQKSVFSTRAW
jgi:hypothetical protein